MSSAGKSVLAGPYAVVQSPLNVSDWLWLLGVEADGACFAAMIETYRRQGDVTRAVELYRRMTVRQEGRDRRQTIHETAAPAVLRADVGDGCGWVWSAVPGRAMDKWQPGRLHEGPRGHGQHAVAAGGAAALPPRRNTDQRQQ